MLISAIQVESYSSTKECFNPLLVSHGMIQRYHNVQLTLGPVAYW